MMERVTVFSACLPGWTPDQVVALAAALGFSRVEWASGPGHAIEDPAKGAELRDLCDRAGLFSAGLSVQDPEVTFETPKAAAPHIALAIALGAPQVRLLAPPYRGGSLRLEQKRARAGLDRLVELAATLVEQQTPERAGVLYDPGNMAIEGYLAPALAIARLGPYLRHVHVKNIAWRRSGDVWRWRHAPLARGVLDWRSIVHGLAAASYRGLFSIDHLGGQASAPKLHSESAFLRRLVADEYATSRNQVRHAVQAKDGGRDHP